MEEDRGKGTCEAMENGLSQAKSFHSLKGVSETSLAVFSSARIAKQQITGVANWST